MGARISARTAERCDEYREKGSLIAVSGSLDRTTRVMGPLARRREGSAGDEGNHPIGDQLDLLGERRQARDFGAGPGARDFRVGERE